MSVVHFSTQVTGGAGEFARSIHATMLDLNMPSLLITREENDIRNTVTVKPQIKIVSSLRIRWYTLLGALGLVENKYATFGIDDSPVKTLDIKQALDGVNPTGFVFYWISYFISFKLISELRMLYPEIPIVFVCLDEDFLTGGCHYTWGCEGFKKSCSDCPSSLLGLRKRKIEYELSQRIAFTQAINPIVFYPTSNLFKMGKESVVLKKLHSAVIPLGAVSLREKNLETINNNRNNKLTLLVRSSSELRKGCDLIIDAIKKIDNIVPDIRSRLEIVSIGDATLYDANLDNYVDHTYLGFVDRNELITTYKKVDALLVASREDAGPIMINECVALDKFVISTPVGVAEDLIVDEKNGLIIQDFTSSAIADALVNALEHPELWGANKYPSNGSETNAVLLTFEEYVQTMMDSMKTLSEYDE